MKQYNPLSVKPTRELIKNEKTMTSTKQYIQHTSTLKNNKFTPLPILTIHYSKDFPNNKYF